MSTEPQSHVQLSRTIAQVSWVRMRDLQILAHAGVVFTADARVDVPAVPPPDGHDGHGGRAAAHALRIGALRATDAGRYECQINTEPKMSLLFDLEVGDADAGAAGGVEALAGEAGVVRASAGGTASLGCEARGDPPPALRWTRDGRPVALRRASVLAESGGGRAVSRLRLSALRLADAGAYECRVDGGPGRVELRLIVDEPGEWGRTRGRPGLRKKICGMFGSTIHFIDRKTQLKKDVHFTCSENNLGPGGLRSFVAPRPPDL